MLEQVGTGQSWLIKTLASTPNPSSHVQDNSYCPQPRNTEPSHRAWDAVGQFPASPRAAASACGPFMSRGLEQHPPLTVSPPTPASPSSRGRGEVWAISAQRECALTPIAAQSELFQANGRGHCASNSEECPEPPVVTFSLLARGGKWRGWKREANMTRNLIISWFWRSCLLHCFKT